MVIVETSIFTRVVCELLPDGEIHRLQLALLLRREQGNIIPGCSGLRKLRWKQPGQGKRGGLRVLYYWDKPNDRIYMVYLFRKSKQSDLTQQQIRELGRLVREEFK